MALRNISNIDSVRSQVHTAIVQKPLLAKTRKLEKCSNLPYQESMLAPLQQNYQPQIRTSSPISSSTSDSFDAPPDAVFPAGKHRSIRELAYKKLHKQKLDSNNKTEKNLKILSPDCLRSNGKLKVFAYNNFGHLTVHIMKGKCYKIAGDTYARIDMLPDQECFYKQHQTKILKQADYQSSESFNYNEKFSFEVNQVNLRDRICVSVWSKIWMDSEFNSLKSSSSKVIRSSNDQLIGCLSFRIKSLMQISRQDSRPCWYHLLPEKIGTLKHFRCHRLHRIHKTTELANNVKITNVNKDLIGMNKLKFLIKRNSEHESYGFTVSGNCPVIVGKVDIQRLAFTNGLRPGDYIAALDGKNVSRATCDSVVKLIKSFKREFEIEVYRDKNFVDAPVENMYYEIPNLVKPKVIIPDRSKVQLARPFNLEVVLEEDENDSESSDIYYNSVIEYSADNPLSLFNVEQIRHVDSDVNTEDERYLDQEEFRLQRRHSIKSLGKDFRKLSLNNIKLIAS